MMQRALTRVLVERERLCGRLNGQRSDVARYAHGLQRPAAVVDRVVHAARIVRAHPGVVLAAGATFLVVRGRSMLGLATRGFALWRLARRAQALLRHVGY
jgi:hypothetical protein